MKILVIGGTRFFGVYMVDELIRQGHDITIATRGRTHDSFGDKVDRVVIDKIAYCSNDVKYVMDNICFDKFIHMSSTAVYENKTMNTIEEIIPVWIGSLFGAIGRISHIRR